MYSRALSAGSKGYGGSSRHQLPYQTQADPTVNRKSVKKSTKATSLRHSSTGKRPIFPEYRIQSEPTSEDYYNGPISNHFTLSRTNSAKTTGTAHSISSVDNPANTLLPLDILLKVEHIFQKTMLREKLFKPELLAVFYMNHGEVEAWYLYTNNKDESSVFCDAESLPTRSLELTQRRQSILRQYYNHFYQYVILYKDINDTEYYRCVGSDLKRRRAEHQALKDLKRVKHTGNFVALGQFWQRFTKQLRQNNSSQSNNGIVEKYQKNTAHEEVRETIRYV